MQAAENLFDLAGKDQSGQMQHDTDSHTGPHIGRASGQIAELVIESVDDLFFDLGIDFVDPFPGVFEIEAALHHLDPKMVLFVYHHAKRLALAHGDRTGAAALGQLAAD